MDLARYNKLKRELDKAKEEQARKEGARDELLKKLKEVWGLSGIEEAEKELAKLREKQEAAQDSFDSAMAKFEEKWGSDERIQD